MAKTNVDNYIDEEVRNIYNTKANNVSLQKEYGLTEEIIRKISKEKNEPDWVLDIRLKALDAFSKLNDPDWGPDISYLDINKIATYVKSVDKEARNWEDVPDDIKDIFDKLGIPESEKKALAGSGAQFDSETVYHNLTEELKEKGVIYTSFDEAIKEYPELVREYFTKAVPIYDHKYIALHYALFSGGSFVYIPEGCELDRPLQSYFRLNAPGAGQFEHTLIVVSNNAKLQFIEGCSAPGYNELNLHAGCVELFVGKNAYLRFSTIENSNFIENKAIGDDFGAVIVNGEHSKIINSNFILNSAERIAGAVAICNMFNYIYNSSFISNSAESGGAVYWDGNNGIIKGCYFENNSAVEGGAIFMIDNNVKIEDSQFINNTVVYGNDICSLCDLVDYNETFYGNASSDEEDIFEDTYGDDYESLDDEDSEDISDDFDDEDNFYVEDEESIIYYIFDYYMEDEITYITLYPSDIEEVSYEDE